VLVVIMAPLTTTLDHIVHLTPVNSLAATVSDFKELGFTVVPGGTHTDGLTSNALVILQDGVYLELLVFNTIPPPSHNWGTRKPGWIDVADLGTDKSLDQVINDRYGGSLYRPTTLGGRLTKTPEGELRELKWRITASDHSVAKGELPFFCGDITPREWRVPTSPPSNVIHPNGVLGVASLTFITPSLNLEVFSAQFTAVYGHEPTKKMVGSDSFYVWSLEVPHPVKSIIKDSGKKYNAEVYLRGAKESDEGQVNRGSGLWEVAFWVSGKGGPAYSKWGRIKYLSVDSV